MAAMTKREFFRCLDMAGKVPTLSLIQTGDGWISQFAHTLYAHAEGLPRRDSKGGLIGAIRKHSVVLGTFAGRSSVIAITENSAAVDRANSALAKFKRWADEWAAKKGDG